MFGIGEFSKMGKTTVKTLRYYDAIGLLKPQSIHRDTAYRLYTTVQLVELHRIQSLRQIGLSTQEILLIMSGQDETPILQGRRSKIIADIAKQNDCLSRIEFILQKKEESVFMNYSATVKELPECIVYSKKMTVPSYDSYFEVLPELGRKVLGQYPDIKCATPEYCFIVSLDGEYKEKDITVEYCEAIDRMKPDFDGVVFKKVEAVTAVSVMHKGSYSEFPKAYAFALGWIEENGYTATAPPRESYIDGIWNKENEADWLTELQIPIAKKQG